MTPSHQGLGGTAVHLNKAGSSTFIPHFVVFPFGNFGIKQWTIHFKQNFTVDIYKNKGSLYAVLYSCCYEEYVPNLKVKLKPTLCNRPCLCFWSTLTRNKVTLGIRLLKIS